ncbi:MAG: TIGR03087 family PEP-CTERM/XrtA system glycosyltransferase [Phycisphaerae bacterium]
MQRLLYISHRVPYPPDKGERVRAFHEIMALSSVFDVTLLALCQEAFDAARLEPMEELCSAVLPLWARGKLGVLRGVWRIARGRSATECYFQPDSCSMRRVDRILQQRFDLAFGYCSSTLPLLLKANAESCAMDLVDVDSAKWRAYARRRHLPGHLLYSREAAAVARLERRALEQCRTVFTVSSAEADLLPPGPAKVVPVQNGVDTSHFRPTNTKPDSDSPALVFTGSMDYEPNVRAVCWFCRTVYPELRQRFPGLRFLIVGRHPVGAVQRLDKLEGVTVTGSVVDTAPYLHQAAVAVAPLDIARGIQNKVLEAAACGVPVVASPEALTGLDFSADQHVLSARSPDEWVEAAARLLTDPAYADRLTEQALRMVRNTYSWPSRMAALVQECVRLANPHQPTDENMSAGMPAGGGIA